MSFAFLWLSRKVGVLRTILCGRFKSPSQTNAAGLGCLQLGRRDARRVVTVRGLVRRDGLRERRFLGAFTEGSSFEFRKGFESARDDYCLEREALDSF